MLQRCRSKGISLTTFSLRAPSRRDTRARCYQSNALRLCREGCAVKCHSFASQHRSPGQAESAGTGALKQAGTLAAGLQGAYGTARHANAWPGSSAGVGICKRLNFDSGADVCVSAVDIALAAASG